MSESDVSEKEKELAEADSSSEEPTAEEQQAEAPDMAADGSEAAVATGLVGVAGVLGSGVKLVVLGAAAGKGEGWNSGPKRLLTTAALETMSNILDCV